MTLMTLPVIAIFYDIESECFGYGPLLIIDLTSPAQSIVHRVGDAWARIHLRAAMEETIDGNLL